MGLDTTHNCFHGPYSTFMRFRRSLADQIGINLDDYVEYDREKGTKSLVDLDHPLQPLFNHSDCEGELSVKESKQIVEGLNSVIDQFDKSKPQDFDFLNRVIQFRDGCLEAIQKKEKIIFQ